MKRLRLLFILLLSLSLTGCIQEYNLTDEESDAVAEYMAGLLLKNDENYEQDLTPLSGIKEENEPEAQPTTAPEEETTENEATEEATSDKDDNEDAVETYTISEVIGVKDFDIQYKSYKLADTYPEDSENAYFTLTPREGYQLLVADFTLKNLKNSKNNLNLSKEKIQYQLDVNVGTVYKPLLTLLENDLQYIDITLKKKESATVLLVFEIPTEGDISDINLMVSKESKSEIIELK